ncbi:MAG: hypothetical protein HQK96_15670 [Nitrospirae bacterium]|nr:hypothetical protein [Nitrospirota bacterium]
MLLFVLLSASHVNAAPQVVILQEPYVGRYLIPPGQKVDGIQGWPDKYYIRFDTVWSDFHKQYSNNNITFEVVIPQVPISMGITEGWYSGNSTSTVSGIGLTTNNLSLIPGVDRFIGLGDYWSWSLGDTTAVNDTNNNSGNMRGMAIEMTHQWCCYAPPIIEAITAYWKNNVNLFYGDTTKGEVMDSQTWVNNNGTWSCHTANDQGITPAFSNITLYMMGLLDRTELAPLTIYNYSPINDGQHMGYNGDGPSCSEPQIDPGWNPATAFTGTQTLSITDIEAALGKRNPSYANSPKNFTAIIFIVVPYGLAVDTNWINTHVNGYFTYFPAFWHSLTKNRSTMTFPDLNKTTAIPVLDKLGTILFLLCNGMALVYYFGRRAITKKNSS